MSTQIRAPKAKKINSYLLSRTPNSDNNFTSKSLELDLMCLNVREKRNSQEKRLLCSQEEEKVCFECQESEYYDQIRNLSVLREINDIVNKPKSFDGSKSFLKDRINRCENPFRKNFESSGKSDNSTKSTNDN